MERKCSCGNFFDVREYSGICPECKTDIFEHHETQNVLGTLNCNYGYNGFKPITALTIFFDKIRVKFDKDSEEYEQLVADYVILKELERQQIIDAYEQGEEDGYFYPENGYGKKYKDAEQYYNETFGN